MRKQHLGHLGWLLFNGCLTTLSVVLQGITIYMLGSITDYGIQGNLTAMFEVARWMFVILVVLLGVNGISAFGSTNYIKASLITMKKHYVSALLEQDISQLQKEKINTYRSHLTNDFDRFQDKYLFNVLESMRMVLRFLMAVVLVATVSLYLVGVAFILLILFVFVISKNTKPVQKSESTKSASLQKYTAFVDETLQGFEIIKQHQLEPTRLSAFMQHATTVQKDNYNVDVKETQVTALNQFFQNAVLFTLVVVGILVARTTSAGLGSIIVVASSFGNIMWPLSQFSPVITQMKGIVKVLDDFDHHLQRPKLDKTYHVSTFEILRFNACDLGYKDEEKPILYNVNLEVKHGEKVLIVGRSGAGKSTILKTIRQNIQPKNGSVTLNGMDIFSIVPIDYFSLFASVDQIGFIFTGSIKDNIAMYQPLSDEHCQSALDHVGLSEFELLTPLVNNGANISGGQRARLLLARALCLRSSVVVCDEIFAALELDIARGIEKDVLALPTTVINVSHIIFKETLHLYDAIYIVEDGIVTKANNIQEVWQRMILTH